jgi:Protein of unknown function (DUF2442)
MKTNDYQGVRASSLAVSASHLDVTLEDGRMLRIPTALFPKLRNAPPDKLSHWEWIGEGIGIEWPELDEFLSVAGFLQNTPYFIPTKGPSKILPKHRAIPRAPKPRKKVEA